MFLPVLVLLLGGALTASGFIADRYGWPTALAALLPFTAAATLTAQAVLT